MSEWLIHRTNDGPSNGISLVLRRVPSDCSFNFQFHRSPVGTMQWPRVFLQHTFGDTLEEAVLS